MNRLGQSFVNVCALVVCTSVVLLASPVDAQLSGFADDAWHSWRIASIDAAPEMCCYSWRGGRASGRGCDLDSRSNAYGSTADRTGGDIEIYVRTVSGEVTDIRALSASCPVTTATPIVDLGVIDNAVSVGWLSDHIVPDSDLASDALAAVSVHDGDEAVSLLVREARASNDQDIREDAIFWMGQARVEETGSALKDILFDDDDPDIREHAAFSYAESGADDVVAVLTRQGREDRDPDVRTHAWFWLAQTGADDVEDVILDAIRNDSDDDVREDAVFALSELPESRAVTALAIVLEDKSLGRDIREQALFWLAQSESAAAFEYIDAILTATK